MPLCRGRLERSQRRAMVVCFSRVMRPNTASICAEVLVAEAVITEPLASAVKELTLTTGPAAEEVLAVTLYQETQTSLG